ncbi:MAG: sulfurtransferase, partial [Acidimicrobiia bacterium]
MTGPLVEPADLAARLDDPDLRVADTRWYLEEPQRGRRQYAASHVPGAIYFDVEHDLSASEGPGRHPLPDRHDFARLLGQRGIGDRHLVVAYDDRGGAVAARLW